MTSLMTEREETAAEGTSAIEEAVFDCLMRYWSAGGVSLEHAETAAHAVIELLLRGEEKQTRTWCVSTFLPGSARAE